MNDAYTITTSDDLTIVRLLRDLNLDEMLELLDVVAARCPGNRRLWDLSKHLKLANEDIRLVAERGKRAWRGPARVALLATDDLSFGLLRVFEAFRSSDGYEIRVFRDEEAALAWLREPDET